MEGTYNTPYVRLHILLVHFLGDMGCTLEQKQPGRLYTYTSDFFPIPSHLSSRSIEYRVSSGDTQDVGRVILDTCTRAYY